MRELLFSLLLMIGLVAGCMTDNQPSEEIPENSTEASTENNTEEVDKTEDQNTEEKTAPEEEEVIPDELTVLAENLNAPWSIEKIENTFYITERPGAIVKVETEEETRQEVNLSDDLATAEEAGFMGFVLASNFTENQQAYAYYTYTNEKGQFNKVVALTLEGDQWTEMSVLLDEIPSGPYHHGGRIKIGPDDLLYVTVGDALNENSAQEQDSLAGKILRMNLDGSIPEKIRLQIRMYIVMATEMFKDYLGSPDGALYASEHGNQANDEINHIEAGKNYGWPLIEGTQEQDGLVSPEFTSGSDQTWAPSGMTQSENKLYVAGLRGNAVFVFDLATGEVQETLTDFGRIRDVYIEEDHLYFITNNTDGRGNPEEADDKLYRISLAELE